MAYVNNVWVGQTEQDNYDEEMYSRKANGLETISFDEWKKQKKCKKIYLINSKVGNNPRLKQKG